MGELELHRAGISGSPPYQHRLCRKILDADTNEVNIIPTTVQYGEGISNVILWAEFIQKIGSETMTKGPGALNDII